MGIYDSKPWLRSYDEGVSPEVYRRALQQEKDV